jgi:hypothetical protein
MSREKRSTMLSRDQRSTIGALIVVVLGALFAFWFGTPAGQQPGHSANEEVALATPAASQASSMTVPAAVGGGPRAATTAETAPISVEGATDPERARVIGVAAGPMDCFTLDGAPYVGTNC